MSSFPASPHMSPGRTRPDPAGRPGLRRALGAALRAVGLSAAIVFATPGFAAAPSPAAAIAFIQTTADRMIAIIDGTDDLPARRSQLQTIVDESVDTEQIARFCLGRHWRVATSAQQQRFVRLFHRVLLDGVTGQINNDRGVSKTWGATPQAGSLGGQTVRPAGRP